MSGAKPPYTIRLLDKQGESYFLTFTALDQPVLYSRDVISQ